MSEAGPIIILEDIRLSGWAAEATSSLSIHPGEFLVVAGGSGSEKSTLLMTAAGLRRPMLGKVSLFGVDSDRMRHIDYPALRRRTGFVFTEPVLIHGLNVAENVELPLRYDDELSREEIVKRVESILTAADYSGDLSALSEDLPTFVRRQVSLARAWVRNPEVVFYDDPANSLDPVSRGNFYRIIHRYHAQRRSDNSPCTTVLACNDPRGVLEFADRFLTIRNGVLTSSADKNNIRARQHQIEKEFFESIQVA